MKQDGIPALDPEQTCRRLQDELQLILDSTPAMIWYKDTENRIIRANHSAALSMGLSKEQIEGRLVAELYPEEAEDDLVVIRTGQPRLGIVEPCFQVEKSVGSGPIKYR